MMGQAFSQKTAALRGSFAARIAAFSARRWLRVAVRLLPLPILALAVWKTKPWNADLSHASWRLLAGALAINLLLYLPIRAFRWRVALSAPPPLPQILCAMLEGFFVGAAFGFGTGDAVRSLRLRKQAGSFARDFGATMAERAAEIVALAILLALAAAIGTTGRWAYALSAAGIAGYLAVLAIGRRLLPTFERWPRLALGLRATLAASTPGRAAGLTLLVLIGWMTEALILMLSLSAFGLPAHPGAALLVLLGVNLAITIPGPPVNMGTFEAGVAAALMAQGIGSAPALAFALSYHFMMAVPVILIGATIFLLRGGRRDS
jgi:uncharacterized membrane protein YbhN (UPF0104 family)